jgi:predicted TIM-barrel fold metal-dependent hydrolase
MSASSGSSDAEVGIVDSHVHLLPGRLAEKVRAFFEMGGPVDFAYPLDHGDVAGLVAAEGVSTVWTLPYAHKPGVAAWLNEQSAATAHRDLAVTVVGGAAVHPGDDDPVGIVRAAVEEQGLRVLKLHCSVGDFDPADRRLTPVWDYVEAVALPVVVHAGHGIDGTTVADELGPVGEVARRHPAAPIVIAHCGHRAVLEALALVRTHPNVHADLTPVLDEHVAIAPEVAAELSTKLLFGTDTPNTPLTTTDCLAHLDSLGLAPDQHAAVAGGNARRLVAGVRP